MDNFTLQQLAMCDGFNNDGSKHHQVSRGKQNSLVANAPCGRQERVKSSRLKQKKTCNFVCQNNTAAGGASSLVRSVDHRLSRALGAGSGTPMAHHPVVQPC